MAEIKGIVLSEVGEGRYLVKVLRDESSCSSCSLSKFCTMGMKNKGEDVVEVSGNNLKVADVVTIEESTWGIVLSSALIFIIPIAVFILGYYLGQFFKLNEIVKAIVGFLLMMLYFLLLGVFDKKLRNLFFRFEVKSTS
ncbi:MAG TPA: SoxR reducing system RseC family protein [Candidatus Hydrothermia bacterium]|nr:SoxR reducing system RseC family protein [Candidatus Hydrothermia bacterium]HOL23907.1 SoxR reducing system RseC family protein [Candidatus Hydrothermia bacterium]HPO78912.1 SoxR reducing system RseC family protein [Candidatus Hydrothermia bacterium]